MNVLNLPNSAPEKHTTRQRFRHTPVETQSVANLPIVNEAQPFTLLPHVPRNAEAIAVGQ